MCNYYATKWKREPINDHKFDFVNVHDFRDTHLWTQLSYCVVVILSLKSVLIYVADIWTTLVLLKVVSGTIAFQPSEEEYKWIFVASIICSFLILLWDAYKSHAIFQSRDIAFAFTDFICYNLFSLKSYSYYCLFHRIENSKNTRDMLAFFVFFRLKRWKRIMLAEAPRQIINGYTIYTKLLLNSKGSIRFNSHMFYGSAIQSASLILIIISFSIFFLSALSIIFALFLYVPLVCQIQGNLKEYVCHKIDKRIARIVKNKAQRRVLENQRRQLERTSLINTFRRSAPSPNDTKLIPSPTLPNVGIECEELSSICTQSTLNSRKKVVSNPNSIRTRGDRRQGSKSAFDSFSLDDFSIFKTDSKKSLSSPNETLKSSLHCSSSDSLISSTTTLASNCTTPLRPLPESLIPATPSRRTPTSIFSDLPTITRSPASNFRSSPLSTLNSRSTPREPFIPSPHHF